MYLSNAALRRQLPHYQKNKKIFPHQKLRKLELYKVNLSKFSKKVSKILNTNIFAFCECDYFMDSNKYFGSIVVEVSHTPAPEPIVGERSRTPYNILIENLTGEKSSVNCSLRLCPQGWGRQTQDTRTGRHNFYFHLPSPLFRNLLIDYEDFPQSF